jgi:hypothetical protein
MPGKFNVSDVKELPKQFGPDYDLESAALKKFRRMARKGLAHLSAEDRRAYGAAVETAVLARQRAFLKSHTEAEPRPRCASGTWHTKGEEIHAAILRQQRAALAAAPGVERRARTPQEWKAKYEAAMAEKRNPTPAPKFRNRFRPHYHAKAKAAPATAPTMTRQQLAAHKAWATRRKNAVK